MLVARRSTVVAAAAVAAAALAASAVTGLASTTHARGATISVFPQVERVGRVSSTQPTIAQCQKAYGIKCYNARQIETAYNLPALYRRHVNGRGTTIAIVDAFGSPTIRHDLAVFDKANGLPSTSLKIIRPAGKFTWKANSVDENWAGETTLDVEYSHAIAPRAKILLVETPVAETEGTAGFPQIVKAENYVIKHRLADVISQSFGATEQTFPTAQSLLRLRSAYIAAAKHNITVLGSSGDAGATDDSNTAGTMLYTHRVTSWPASDPLVTAVGGTMLNLNSKGQRLNKDVAWNDSGARFGAAASGGGRSVIFSRPSFQNRVSSVTGNHRGVPDISMSASISGAVNIYTSFAGSPAGWYPTAGTSEASPEFAGIVAMAAQVAGHGLGVINPALYRLGAQHASGIVPVTSGNNTVTFKQGGKQYTVTGFSANKRYSLVTGLGTVNAKYFVPQLARAAR